MERGQIMDVKVYSTPTCGYCHQAKKFLNERGVIFSEFDVSRDQAAAQEMMKLTGQMGVPVIVIDGQTIIGFDKQRLEGLLSSGNNGKRPRFGLKIADASRMAQKVGAVPVFGAYVGAVAPNSLGEKAGIQTGDIITEINMRPVNNADDLENALAGLSAGGKVTIEFLRGQESLRAEISV